VQNFIPILLLTNGGPGSATLVPGLDMYQSAFSNDQYGYGMAIGTIRRQLRAQPDRGRGRLRVLRHRHLPDVRPGRLHHAPLRFRTHRRSNETVTPAGLRCAHLDNPLGVAPDRARFGWEDGCAQAAFQLQVFTGDRPYWDSGEITSAESADVPYGGPPLAPGGRYWWRVRVRNEAGVATRWSQPATFEVELDPDDGWLVPSWIGLGPVRESFTPPSGSGPADHVAEALRPAPYLRREFAVSRPVEFARLHITALGLYEARLNGHRIGDAFLTPGWTDYDRRVLYQTYDVTTLLAEGPNVLGAVIADGWYSGFVGFDAKRAGAHYGQAPELLAQLVITFTDGGREVIGTDASWAGRFAAIRHADLLMGERHDLRLEPAGWDAPGFTAGPGWRPVQCRRLDGRTLAADPAPPARVTQEIVPVRVWRDKAGRQLADFGQNLTGWVRLRVTASAGTVIRGSPWRDARRRRIPVHTQPAHRTGHR
jgi:alpha-L-rhamnosidase